MQTIPSPMNRISAILILFLAALAGCKKDTTIPPANTSEGILLNDNGTCQSAKVHGFWYNGVSSDTSYVDVSVLVTKAGPYHIITDDQDGVVFSADGNFADTGIQNVHLKPNGLFHDYGTIHFVTAYNYSPCTLSLDIRDSAYHDQPDNTWQFTANGHVYKGTGTALYTHLPTYAADTYTFYGSMDGYTDTSLVVSSLVYNFEHPDDPNHYTSNNDSYFSFVTSRSVSPRVGPWSATSTTAPAAVMNVIKSNYTNIYKFNGAVSDSAGNVIPITDGRYRADTYRYVSYE
ncbi:MAG TPA: hypothetical protein VHD83_25825 [Puia sp.]|nr:hypothetical protein [Puia sp.]